MDNMILLLGGGLFVKHFVADFLYQPPYQWQNKGTYGHPGGLVHSGQHAILSLVLLLFFVSPMIAVAIAAGEFIIHYHMDWFKMRYNKLKGWGATTHNQFWVLLGVDQLVHSLTYIGIMGIVNASI
jgi:hypothetical protein